MARRLVITAVYVWSILLLVSCVGQEGQETPESSEITAIESRETAVLPTVSLPDVPSSSNTATPTPPSGLTVGEVSPGSGEEEPAPTLQTLTPLPNCVYAYSLIESNTQPSLVLETGSGFLQTWRIRNEGSCTWEPGSSWVFAGGAQMGGPDLVALPGANPGQIVDVSLTLVAPPTPGTFTGIWQPQMADGRRIEPISPVTISVIPPQPTATAVLPTATPIPVITGWLGEYYDNRTLTGEPRLVRDDQEINFNWGTRSPGEGLQNGNFSVRWRRKISAIGGTYRFFARSEDGVRVWVNGLVVFDEWHDGQNATYQSEVTLSPGEELDVQVEYYHATGLANVHVWAELQTDFPNWRGSYINDPNLAGQPVLIRNDPEINFDWGLDAPAAGMRPDNFSVVWIRTLNFKGATYQFNAVVDDGMRLLVDDKVVIDEWRDGTAREVSGIISIPPGFHDITVAYYDRLAEAEIHVWWEIVADVVQP